MSMRVLRPGLLMTVQDLGRHGHQHVGLCPGGAMDPMSLKLANALVKNDVGAAALELTVLGPDLHFERDTLIALVGAEFEADFPINRPVLVKKNARVSISRAARGARGYLAVAGGIAVEPVLGSRSTYLPGEFGGIDGRVLKRGDLLPLAEDSRRSRSSASRSSSTSAATACAGTCRRSRCPTASRSFCMRSRASISPSLTPTCSARSSTRCGA